MTLLELHKRLGEIIEYNNKSTWSERNNDMPVYILMQELTPTGRQKDIQTVEIREGSSGLSNGTNTVTGDSFQGTVICVFMQNGVLNSNRPK